MEMITSVLTMVGRTKAVANGALAWALTNSVTTRINKYHYGCKVFRFYSASDPDMIGRPVHHHMTGRDVVRGCWSTVIAQVSLLTT
jgi:hypothetical protein